MRRLSLRQQAEIALARRLVRLPPGVLGRIAGRPVVRDGNVLDAQIQLSLHMNRIAGRKPTYLETVAEARSTMEANGIVFSPSSPELALVEDIDLPGPAGAIPARVYRPHGLARPAPALMYIHGGGFVVGSRDSHDMICRAFAAAVPCVVISIEYRLAPEHPFPAAVDDAVAAFRAIAREAARMGIDPARIAVGGDSAGGNLSAGVAQETRADAVRPCLQLLVYPGTDMTMSSPSVRTFGEGFFLDNAFMDLAMENYLTPEQTGDERASIVAWQPASSAQHAQAERRRAVAELIAFEPGTDLLPHHYDMAAKGIEQLRERERHRGRGIHAMRARGALREHLHVDAGFVHFADT